MTPTGLPAWTRTASPDLYGYHPDKRNLGNVGVVNARTDIGADQYNRMALDCAVATMTAPLFWLFGVLAYNGGSTTNTFDVTQCCTMWGGISGAYTGALPPSDLFPTIEDDGTHAALVLTFPGLTTGGVMATSDAYGVSGQFEFVAANASHYTAGATDAYVSGTSIVIPHGAGTDRISLVVR